MIHSIAAMVPAHSTTDTRNTAATYPPDAAFRVRLPTDSFEHAARLWALPATVLHRDVSSSGTVRIGRDVVRRAETIVWLTGNTRLPFIHSSSYRQV